jgi:hypothetical protein
MPAVPLRFCTAGTALLAAVRPLNSVVGPHLWPMGKFSNQRMSPFALPLFLMIMLIGMVLGWFFLITKLFGRLERSHTAKYEAMGRPTLFVRNNIATGFATMKFIFAREHRDLGDTQLSKLSDFMLGYFVLYIAIFGLLLAVAPSQQASVP